MLHIELKVIPHKCQRYPTVGDYIWADDNDFKIIVSNLGNPDYEFLVGLHEIIESYICKKRGIKEEEITAFDEKFEENRLAGFHSPKAEPGDNPHSPYRKEHFFATNIERLVAAELGVDWQEYEAALTTPLMSERIERC